MSPLNAFPPRRWFIGGLVAVVLFVGAMPGQTQAEPSLQQVFDGFFGTGVVSATDTDRATFPAGTYQFKVIARCAGADAAIGWYPANDPETLNTIFPTFAGGGATCGVTVSPQLVTITEEFGLWMTVGANTFFSNPDLNETIECGESSCRVDHFVVANVPGGGFAIGIEDLPPQYPVGEPDFQDAVLFLVAPNRPPFFNVIADQFVGKNADQQDVGVTGVSPGPLSEAGQTVVLTATSSNPALIPNPIVSPVSGGSATLMYQPVANASGTVTITLKAQDNGGTSGCVPSIPPCDTFTRSFQITVVQGVASAVQAAVTGFTSTGPTTAPTVNVTVTFSPIDFTGDGKPDCYFVFPPTPYNVIPTNADRTPEAPPWSIPGNLVQVCGATAQFTTSLDLNQWITTPGTKTSDLTYVNLVRDPLPGASAPRIFTGIIPAGSVSFKTGDQVADKTTVTLHTVELAGGSATDKPLPGVIVRIYDRNSSVFQAAYGGKNPPGSSYPTIFEASVGFLATCTTDGSGVCLATEANVGDYLVIIKFSDCVAATGNTGVVYDGLPKGPADFVHGVATKNFTIVKKLLNGTFQGYQTGSRTTFVPGCH